jgi:hypothetical protein
MRKNLSYGFGSGSLVVTMFIIANVFRDYLTCEWKAKMEGQETRQFTKANMPGCSPKVNETMLLLISMRMWMRSSQV